MSHTGLLFYLCNEASCTDPCYYTSTSAGLTYGSLVKLNEKIVLMKKKKKFLCCFLAILSGDPIDMVGKSLRVTAPK